MILKEVISTSKELDDSPCRYSERIQNGVGKMGDDAFGVWHWTLLQSWKLLIKSEVVSANDCFLSLFPHFSHLKVLILLAPLHGCSLLSCRQVSSAQNRLSAGSMLRLRRRGPDLTASVEILSSTVCQGRWEGHRKWLPSRFSSHRSPASFTLGQWRERLAFFLLLVWSFG